MPAKLDQKAPKEALEGAEEREANYKEKQARTFDEKHKSTPLPQLCTGHNVWVLDQEQYGCGENLQSMLIPVRDQEKSNSLKPFSTSEHSVP